MPKCIIDGKEIEFKPGENMIEVARRAKIEIPYFCYHPGLTIVAQCRMCAVEIEKMPKLATACSTPVTDGMVVYTKSEKVKKNQRSVMEFLLINHPLDCPVCDKAGECDLQDNSFKFGDAYMRTTEDRRTYVDLDMGPVIKKNMNRCIHCTRCIRFGDEIAHIREMVAVMRGNKTEITTISGLPLETEYAGNYSDVCPTGSLTLKDFRFKKRAWYLKKTPTICEGCSKGCNMEIQQDANVIYRCIPRENLEVNRYWMCDEGRFNYHYVGDKDRVLEPRQGLVASEWFPAIEAAKTAVKGKKTVVLVGSDLTQEEVKMILEVTPQYFGEASIFHFGTPGVKTTADDAPFDNILKMKSKTSNLFGVEKLGVKPFGGLPPGTDAVIVFRGGRAVVPDLLKVGTVVGVGVFSVNQSEKFTAILPGISFAEKDGTVFNHQGREQKFKRAIQPQGKSKALAEILMMWANASSKAGAMSGVMQ